MPLPFTRGEFVELFAAYNAATWPLAGLTAALGALVVVLLVFRPERSGRTISASLAFFWLLTGAGYHLLFFTSINDAAWLFGMFFLLASFVFLLEGVIRRRIHFGRVCGLRAWMAAGLAGYALVIYPLLGLLLTHPYPYTPLFGTAPCPTTIFTLAVLLLARHPRPWLLAAVPLGWALIGGSAAILLEVPADLGLFAAGLAWLAARCWLPLPRASRQGTAS